jgi:vacuolar-type H+-ATPase subunit I/STV1
MGAVFAFMALDEVWTIHERLEGWTGMDWQIAYVPIAVGAGLLVVVAFRDLAAIRGAAGLFVAGGAAWLAAQVLEALQWAGDVLEHEGMIVPEEVLELVGSSLFGLASLVVLRRVVATREA